MGNLNLAATEQSLESISDVGICLPVNVRGLEGFFLPYLYTPVTSKNKLYRNFVHGKPNASVVGAPVVSRESVHFKGGANYLTTSIAETADFTFYIVCKSADAIDSNATKPSYLGNDYAKIDEQLVAGVVLRSSPNDTTDGLVMTAPRIDGTTVDNGSVWFKGHEHATWSLIWGRCDGLVTELHNVTQNLSAVKTFTHPRKTNDNKVLIGSGRSSYTGESDISRVVWVSRAHDAAEVEQMVAFMRAQAAARGITV